MQQYFDCHPPGTWAHLVVDVLLNVGCRISDGLAIGPRNLSGKELHYTSQKTNVDVDLLLPDGFYGRVNHVYTYGRRFIYHPKNNRAFESYRQFYYEFDKALKLANLPRNAQGVRKTAHGLRKTCATRLANRGLSASQIQARQGWQTLEAAELYVREADRKKLGTSEAIDFDALIDAAPS